MNGSVEKAKRTTCGDWKIEDRIIVHSEGVTQAIWITDGRNEMVTTAKPSNLMIALALHLGVDHWEQPT